MAHTFSYPENRYLLLGTVAKAQGLRGEIVVHAMSGQPESFGHYPAFTLVDTVGKLSPRLGVRSFRTVKGKVILGLDRVSDRTMAEQMVGMGVLVDKSDLPQPAEDEFYWHELQGLAVRTRDGQQLGKLLGQFSNGAHDIMVIGDNASELLVPVLPGVIVTFSATELVIDPPPGLLSMDSDDDE